MATALIDSETEKAMPGFTNAVYLPAAALCAALASSGVSATSAESVVQIPEGTAPMATFAQVDATLEGTSAVNAAGDLMPHPMTVADLDAWGRSMMGGDTSQMLDI